METKLKHSKGKYRHKYFGLSRIASAFGVFAAIALLCMCAGGVMSTTANAKEFTKDDIMLKLLEVEADIAALSTSSGGGTAEILAAIRATHLVDPFDVAVSICTEIAGGAEIEGLAHLGIGACLEAHLGVDFYGSGAQIGIEPGGEIGAGLNIRSAVKTNVTACINGIFTRQTPDTTEEAAIIALGRNATEIALLTELVETGNRYSDRIATSANTMKLLEGTPDTGSDRLNNSLDAFEAFSTLDLKKIAAIIVNTGDSNTPNTALDDFAASMPNFGLDGLCSSSGLPSVVNLGSNSVNTIGTTITSSITALGFGSSNSAGLGGLTTGLSGFESLKTAFEGIPNSFGQIEGAINQIPDTFVTLLNIVCTALGGSNCIVVNP